MDDKRNMYAVLARYINFYRQQMVVFEQGDPGKRMYIILEGEVRISQKVPGAESKKETVVVELAVLKAGDFFGEMAVFSGKPRSATAETLTDCRLISLTRKEILDVIAQRPEFALRILEALCLRLAQMNQEAGMYQARINLLEVSVADRQEESL